MGPKRTQQDKSKGHKGHGGVIQSHLSNDSAASQKYFKGQFASSVYDRAERIAIATQFIMDRVQGNEEIKKHVNEHVRKALDMLSVSDILRDEDRVWAVLGHLRTIVTGFEALRFSGVLSSNISGLLVQAIDDLASILSAASKSSSVGVAVTESFFEPAPLTSGTRSVEAAVRHERPAATTSAQRTPKQRSVQVVRNSSVHQGRRDRIIDILRTGPATITEISAKMPDCGPKTVQRELAALVKARAIVAKGERRWRTYSVVEGH